MALRDLFRKPKQRGLKSALTMGGNAPFYTAFGDNIYASDIIVQAISRISVEAKKLQPRHIRTTDGRKQVITDSSIAKCLRNPNKYMTSSEFLEKCFTLLNLNKNLFIYHEHFYNVFGERITTGLYPLKPSYVEYQADEAGELFIYMEFASGYSVTLPLSSVTHYRKAYGAGDYFGGNISGTAEKGLLKLLREYDKITQGIAKTMAASCSINGIVQLNTYLSGEKIEEEKAAFQKRIENNESGIMFVDQKAEYTNFPRDVKLVDAETLKFFNQAILRNMGVSIAILNADYTPQQKQAFYETAMEADVIGLGQALTKTEFSDRKVSFGNEIALYPNKTEFMTPEQKIGFLQVAAPAGAVKRDEIRELFGYEPLENGRGQELTQGYNLTYDTKNNDVSDEGKAKNDKKKTEGEGNENEE